MTQTGLIYDIGAHRGDDTAWYLQQGYRVVAVEANPMLVQGLKQTYAEAIAAGRLTVLNVAITEKHNEETQFYISRDDWRSSTNQHIAEREATVVQTTHLKTATLAGLINTYGTPHYCKIDIEGNDVLAIRSLTGNAAKPQYISCEISCHSIGDINNNNTLLFETLEALKVAGYTSFQLIDQESQLQLTEAKHYSRLYTFHSRLRTKWERLTGWYTRRYSNRYVVARDRNTSLDYVTTPFGEALTGNWTDYDATRRLIQFHFNDYHTHTNNKQLIFWVDLHARN